MPKKRMFRGRSGKKSLRDRVMWVKLTDVPQGCPALVLAHPFNSSPLLILWLFIHLLCFSTGICPVPMYSKCEYMDITGIHRHSIIVLNGQYSYKLQTFKKMETGFFYVCDIVFVLITSLLMEQEFVFLCMCEYVCESECMSVCLSV